VLATASCSSLAALTSAFHTRRINLIKPVEVHGVVDRKELRELAGEPRTPHHGSKLRIQSCTFKTYMHMYKVRQVLTAHRPYIHYEVLFS
jgi:hypothetical protein